MSAAALMTIATRLVALYLLAQTAMMVPIWVPTMERWLGDDPAASGIGLTLLAAAAVSLVIIALLWFGAPFIARCAVQRSNDTLLIQKIDVRELTSMAIAVAGLIMLVSALPRIAIVGLQQILLVGKPWIGTSTQSLLQLGAETLRLILGLVLLLGAPGLTRLLYKLRFAGQRRVGNEEVGSPPPQL